MKVTALICVVIWFVGTTAYHVKLPIRTSAIYTNTNILMRRLGMVAIPNSIQKADESQGDHLMAEYIRTPREIDRTSVISTIHKQTFLLAIALAFGVVFEIDVLRSQTLSLNKDNLFFGFLFGLPSLVASYVSLKVGDKISEMNIFRNARKQSKLTTLRLFGRKSPEKEVALVTAAISFCSGISEEIFFRGFCYSVIANFFGDMRALLGSSLIFALAHFTIFGDNILTEFVFGMILALLFTTSGYNLFVPMIAHILHDFFFLFSTWKHDSSSLRERFLSVKTIELLNSASKDPFLFQSISRTVFDFLDTNGDGIIDEEDFARGINLFTQKSRTFKKQSDSSKELFHMMDMKNAGLLSYHDFYTMTRQNPMQFGWLFRAGTVINEEI